MNVPDVLLEVLEGYTGGVANMALQVEAKVDEHQTQALKQMNLAISPHPCSPPSLNVEGPKGVVACAKIGEQKVETSTSPGTHWAICSYPSALPAVSP